MDNFLSNGAVLPFGLLGDNAMGMLEGYAKTYQNFALRVGVVVASYTAANERNHSKLAMEYDVMVMEQNADKGATTILYRNCLSSEGLGSIADFFEKTLRPKKKKTKKGDAVDLKGQDGAIVLLLCLDGMSDKGIILGQLTHPDRKTTLTSEDPRLEGEYNGVNIKVEKDGSCKLTFRGATNSEGTPTNASQGNTTIAVEVDGTVQLQNEKVTFRMDRSAGTATLTASMDVNIQCANAKIDASGKVDINSGGETNVKAGGDCNVTAGGKAVVKASAIELNGASSGITTKNSHQGVIDFITGVPVQPSTTVKSDV